MRNSRKLSNKLKKTMIDCNSQRKFYNHSEGQTIIKETKEQLEIQKTNEIMQDKSKMGARCELSTNYNQHRKTKSEQNVLHL